MRSHMIALMITGFVVAASVAPLGSAQLSTSAVVGNLVPVVQDVAVNSTVNPTAGGTTLVPVTITISDANGFQDLVGVTVTVYKPDGSTVHIAGANASSNADGSGVAETFDYDFTMAFHDAPAIGNDTYKVVAVAEDAAGGVSVPFTATFSYTELVAMSLDVASLDFGAIDPGARSSSATLTVTNKGNTLLDLDSSGTGLAHEGGQTIAVDRVKYDLVHSNMTTERALTSTPYTNAGFDLAFGPSVSQATTWQLDVPSGEEQYLPAGSYSGTVTLSAIQG